MFVVSRNNQTNKKINKKLPHCFKCLGREALGLTEHASIWIISSDWALKVYRQVSRRQHHLTECLWCQTGILQRWSTWTPVLHPESASCAAKFLQHQNLDGMAWNIFVMLRSVCIQERRQGHSSTRSIVKSFQNKRRIWREARVKWCTKARKKKKKGVEDCDHYL